jgi:hypothetical protein
MSFYGGIRGGVSQKDMMSFYGDLRGILKEINQRILEY